MFLFSLSSLLEDKYDCIILISMDANAHSPMWGSLDSNSRGDMIEQLIFQHGLIICNKGSSPTFVGRGKLVKSRWKVDTRDHLSDHRRITFMLDREAQAQPSQVWATKKADWCKFSTLMGDRSLNFRPYRFWTAKTLDRETRLFYCDLKYCISKVRRYNIDKPFLGGMLTYLHKEIRLGISNSKL